MIEALVALVVVAAGMLGVAGMQAGLQRGAELARLRATALRIAQTDLEAWRTALARDPAAEPPQPELEPSVTPVTRDLSLADDGPGLRTMTLQARWEDRAGQLHQLQLATAVALLPAELSGSLLQPAGPPVRQPQGRHPAIPRAAVDLGNGTSAFAPAAANAGDAADAATQVRWVFEHTTGRVTSTCTGSTCTAVQASLLAGHVRFGPGLGAAAATPDLRVTVRTTAPEDKTIDCITRQAGEALSYHCLVPRAPGPQGGWSGRTLMTQLPLAASIDDARAQVWRVCRYTPVRGSHPEVDGLGFTNRMHPLDYHGVTESLTGQNYLVIPAGDGVQPAPCPGDDPATPEVNDNTWHHQPSR